MSNSLIFKKDSPTHSPSRSPRRLPTDPLSEHSSDFIATRAHKRIIVCCDGYCLHSITHATALTFISGPGKMASRRKTDRRTQIFSCVRNSTPGYLPSSLPFVAPCKDNRSRRQALSRKTAYPSGRVLPVRHRHRQEPILSIR